MSVLRRAQVSCSEYFHKEKPTNAREEEDMLRCDLCAGFVHQGRNKIIDLWNSKRNVKGCCTAIVPHGHQLPGDWGYKVSKTPHIE